MSCYKQDHVIRAVKVAATADPLAFFSSKCLNECYMT